MKILVGIPTIQHQLTADIGRFLFSVARCVEHHFSVRILNGSSPLTYPVEYQRNEMVRIFLESDADYLWFVDSDVLPTENSVELLKQLGKAECVAGIYPILSLPKDKSPEMVWSFYEARDNLFTEFKDKSITNRVMEADAAGTGCMLLSRKLLSDKRLNLAPTLSPPAIFHTPRLANGKVGGTEDMNFCGRIRKLGYKILVDTSVRWGHMKFGDLNNVLGVGAGAFESGYKYAVATRERVA
jgi:hypothetical protein